MARLTPQQRREKALAGAVSRAKTEMGFRTDTEIAVFLGMNPSTYSYYRRKNFQNMDIDMFGTIARKIGLTGREICAAMGVQYEDQKEVY